MRWPQPQSVESCRATARIERFVADLRSGALRGSAPGALVVFHDGLFDARFHTIAVLRNW
jgi:hypothetical protein